MKKALILTLAMATFAQAEVTTVTYDSLFDSNEGWTVKKGRDRDKSIVFADGTATANNCNWGQFVGSHTISGISLEKPTDTLSFSFDINTNGTLNTVAVVSLIGSQGCFASGLGYYNDGGTSSNIQFGTSTDSAVVGHVFSQGSQSWDNGVATVVSSPTNLTTIGTNGSVTISGTVAWDATASQFALTLNNYATPILLGETYDLSAITLAVDGPNNGTVASFSNLSITAQMGEPEPVVPEPATATLSLLALAGLCARRRRK